MTISLQLMVMITTQVTVFSKAYPTSILPHFRGMSDTTTTTESTTTTTTTTTEAINDTINNGTFTGHSGFISDLIWDLIAQIKQMFSCKINQNGYCPWPLQSLVPPSSVLEFCYLCVNSAESMLTSQILISTYAYSMVLIIGR